MYLERFEVNRNPIPIHHYMDGMTAYYSVNPTATFTLSFDGDAEVSAFHQWLISAQGKGFREPLDLTPEEQLALASEENKKAIKAKDERIQLLYNQIQDLQGKVKGFEKEKEEREREQRRGSISSLEL